MKYFKPIVFTSAMCLLISSSFATDDNIYTWRSANGTVNFSQTAPMFDEEYERVGVHHNNQIHQKSPVEQQLSWMKQNNTYIPEQSQTESQTNTQQAGNGIQKVRIISPAPGQNMFVHNEKLSIILEPTLTAKDHPIFIMNGIPHPAHFENGVWKINRPNPGQAVISVRGRTHDHKTITSGESEFTRRQVLGR